MLDRLPDDGGGRISSGGRCRICLCLGISWGIRGSFLENVGWLGVEGGEGDTGGFLRFVRLPMRLHVNQGGRTHRTNG